MIWFLLAACTDYGVTGHEIVMQEYRFEAFYYTGPVTDMDVLVVIDTSGSMNDDFEVGQWPTELTQMAMGLDALLPNWEMIVISADPMRPTPIGRLRAHDPDLALNAFLVASAAATLNTTREEGLAAALGAVDLLRREVPVLGVLISDEQDQSAVAPVDFVSLWASIGIQATWTAIVEPDRMFSPCGADPGEGYLDVVALTSGVAADLCTYNQWEGVIDPVVAPLTIRTDQWTLAEPADPGSIRVWIDDARTDQWAYLPAERAVRITTPLSGDHLIGVAYLPPGVL